MDHGCELRTSRRPVMCSVAITLVVGLQFLRLTQERTFRENEIRRLSPSGRADFEQRSVAQGHLDLYGFKHALIEF
jgi:hypothetical protein